MLVKEMGDRACGHTTEGVSHWRNDFATDKGAVRSSLLDTAIRCLSGD